MNADGTKAQRRIALWLLVGFLGLYISLTRGHFSLSDEVQVFQQTRSLWERGDLSVAPQVNAVRGSDGRYFAQYGIGQSVLALPFYVTGKTVHEFLERAGAESWIRTFEGPPIGDPDKRWGGEVEIFFVNLFCAFVMAALMVVFYLFNLKLGASPRWAVAATLILGITTHVAGFSVEFLQHPAEALSLLLAFYLLFSESKAPNSRYRWLAGLVTGVMILVRASSLVLVPGLGAYLLWNAYQRSTSKDRDARLSHSAVASIPFVIPIIVAVYITMAVNNAKFGQFSIAGSYLVFNSFTNSWLVSLYGWLFSPGQSVFLFTPVLGLAPFYFRSFEKKRPGETALILALTASYAVFYGRAVTWHGQWCFGPRYLMAMIPLLLLPLGSWLSSVGRAAWFAIIPLLMVGAFIEVLHVSCNVAFVYYREGYDKLVPADAYLFIPQICQIVAHWHALLACDDRVDMWLVNVARQAGALRAIGILIPLSALSLLAAVRVTYYLCAFHDEKKPQVAKAPVSAASHKSQYQARLVGRRRRGLTRWRQE